MQAAETMQVAAPLIGLTVNVLAQMLTFRIRPGFGLLRSEYLGFAIGLLGVLLLNGTKLLTAQPVNWPELVGITVLTGITYGALGYGYFHFVNLGETARRIRLLRELYEAGGGLGHQQLLARYSAKEIVDKRLRRLLGTGQIVCREQSYFIGSPVMVMIARLMISLKIILLGKASEYDA